MTRRPSGWPISPRPGPPRSPPTSRRVQDLFYYYDPVGNVTQIADDADTQDVIFFRNQRVEPVGRLYLRPAVPADHGDRARAPRPDRRRALAAAAGHQRRLVPHRLAAARRRERDGHIHRDLQLRRRRQHPVHGAPGQLRQLDTALQPTPSRRRSSRPRPATGCRPPACPAIRRPAPSAASLPARRGRQHDADAASRLADLGRGRPAALDRAAGRGSGTPQTAYYVYDGGGQRVRKVTDWHRPQRARARPARPSGSTSAPSRSTGSTRLTARQSP